MKGLQIDHAIDELARNPFKALDPTNLGIRTGHARVPGGSHNAATEARVKARGVDAKELSEGTSLERARPVETARQSAPATPGAKQISGEAGEKLMRRGAKFLVKRLLNAIPIAGAIFTAATAEGSVPERAARAAASEVGIGPFDLEFMFDIYTSPQFQAGYEARVRQAREQRRPMCWGPCR
jgi:hypothetical protein